MRNENGSLSAFGFIVSAFGILVVVIAGVWLLTSLSSEQISAESEHGEGLSSIEVLRITRTAEAESEDLPVIQTRRAVAGSGQGSSSGYSGDMEWEHERPRKIILTSNPIPAEAILSIRGPRFTDGSGLFTVWVLDADGVKGQLLMNTTDSWDSENFRLREAAYGFDIDSTDNGEYKIEIERLP